MEDVQPMQKILNKISKSNKDNINEHFDAFFAHIRPKENYLGCLFMKKKNEFSCLFGHNIISELVLLFHKNITKLVFLWLKMSKKTLKC